MAKKKYQVPLGCPNLVEAIFKALTEEDETIIRYVKEEFRQAAAWIEGLPDDTSLADIDIITNAEWPPQEQHRIRAAQTALKNREGRKKKGSNGST